MRCLLENEEGQGMVEYGLIIVLVSVVIIAALTTLGDKVSTIFTGITSKLTVGN